MFILSYQAKRDGHIHPPLSRPSFWASLETLCESNGGFGLNQIWGCTYNWTVWTILCCVGTNTNYWYRRRRERQKGQSNRQCGHPEISLSLEQGGCKEVAVRESSLLICPSQQPSLCFQWQTAQTAWHDWATLSHHHEQEQPACTLGIIWVHPQSFVCPSHSSPCYHCFLLESATSPSWLLLLMFSSFVEWEQLS